MDTNKTQIQENSWIPFQEVDFDDQSIIQYHIDTRDFHCSTNKEELTVLGDKINWDKISKYPERFYFFTGEVKSFLNRIYDESKGEGEWRMLILDIPKSDNWNLKYIRIYRIAGETFLICNKDSYALKREILDARVIDEYLNHIKKADIEKEGQLEEVITEHLTM